ncbi:MAG: hypothetical protein ACOYBE_06800 [Blautia sp.]|jgi:two-component system sensor histidine kinase CiaH
MINKLRKRFIIIAMVSMCAVLAVIMGAINILNYQRILADADYILEILADNGGSFPQIPIGKDGSKAGEKPEGAIEKDPAGEGVFKDGPGNEKDGKMKGLSPETPFETRYFTVSFSSDGSVTDTDTGKIAAVDSADVLEYAKQAKASGKEKGLFSSQRGRFPGRDDHGPFAGALFFPEGVCAGRGVLSEAEAVYYRCRA